MGAVVEAAVGAEGRVPEVSMPVSVCHVYYDVQPMGAMRIEAEYSQRGDGVIRQKVRQHYDPQPRGEDLDWARALYADFLGVE